MSFPLQLGDYGPVIDYLITDDAFSAYCNGQTVVGMLGQLENLRLNDLFPAGIRDKKMAQCCLSGLWLLHNFLDRSHNISQTIKTPDGSFWHAIMHRLEKDYWNSKYWYRNAGDHEVLDRLSQPAREIISGSTSAGQTLVNGNWNADGFVDFCAAEQGSDNSLSQKLACLEWQLLFDHCFQGATGAPGAKP